MIKKIYHTGDWHLRCYQRHDEFVEATKLFADYLYKQDLRFEEGLILIAGDLFDDKEEVTPENYLLMGRTLRMLLLIHPVLIIMGNHDRSSNKSRLDQITPIVDMMNSPYLKYSKKSEIFDYYGICFVHYCFIDGFNVKPPEKSNELIIGLYHDILQNAKLPFDPHFENRNDKKPGLSLFDGCDVVLMGDIHFPQEITIPGISAYYCGSLYQQNIGEPVNQHGFGVLDTNTLEYNFIELETSYGQYKMNIFNLQDLLDGGETILNII